MWVGFFALFRGISEIVIAFEPRSRQHAGRHPEGGARQSCHWCGVLASGTCAIWQINPDTQNFHVCTIAVHPELNLETVHIGGSVRLVQVEGCDAV